MGMIGTFDGFTTARLGIYAAQHGLRVTGNNISNINTTGYTRQALTQVSMKVGGADMYRSMYDNHVGNGALVTSINQIRDPYLDIQFRNTNCTVGYGDTWLSGLNDIAQILDEVNKGIDSNKTEKGDGILYAQLRDLRDMLMQLHNDPNKDNDTLVRNSAETLCQLFNTYAKNLEQVRQDLDDAFKKQLNSVNEILTNIRNLNETIRNAEIVGDNALELRDERNLLLDELSNYMAIKVEYVMDDIGGGKQVERLNVYLDNANPEADIHTDETQLINGIYGAHFIYPEQINGVDNTNYTLQVSNMVDSKNRLPPKEEHNKINAGRPITLADNDIYGGLQALRELLTEKGEFSTADEVALDPDAASKRGIPYYQLSLDLLARKFAEVYNDLNQGVLVDENGNPISPITGTIKELQDMGIVINPAEGTDGGFGDGYYVREDGTYMGTSAHYGGCVLDKAGIKATDTVEEAIQKIKDAKIGGFENIDPINDRAGALAALKAFMKEHGVDSDQTEITLDDPKVGGPLFSNSNDGDDTEGITAGNISVSHSWSIGNVRVVPKFTLLFDGDIQDSTQNTNIDHMISMIEESLEYNPQDLIKDAVSSKLFKGSFNDMFCNMESVLAEDQRTTNIVLNSDYNRLVDIDTQRDGVSGVDLNDEAMNMMQFQKAYSAACRMMTTIDEALDRLINNTGIAGR